MKVLYVFPDTNVFLQCKPLEQVSWSEFGDWDRIEVLLIRPVQTEIDALKGKGNGRQASRARLASSLTRKLLDTEGGRITLRENPLVQLCLRHDLRRDESASMELNYEERDDQLVGTALEFQKSDPGAVVWLLTNDTGPMASAKAVGLKYHAIPEEWLLSPETDDSEKREAALKAEIVRYKSLEPSFEIGFSPVGNTLEASLITYRELSKSEITQLLNRLTTKFPLCTDFGPTETQERLVDHSAVSQLLGRTKMIFRPATSDEINNYREAYAAWEQECTERFVNLPSSLDKVSSWPRITVQIGNVGSRPADDALVILDVKGNIFLQPPEHQGDDGEEDDREGSLKLHPPPSPPKGRWEQRGLLGVSRTLLGQARVNQAFLRNDIVGPLLRNLPSRRDPNALYFKVGRRGSPNKHIEYECTQWRHSQLGEEIELDVLCPLQPGTHSACVRVEVHAANLTRPATAELPIRLTVKESSCFEIAQEMVAALDARATRPRL